MSNKETSPFLSPETQTTEKKTDDYRKNSGQNDYTSSKESIEDSKSKSNFDGQSSDEAISDKKNDGVIEIEDEGKILKKIITFIIIFLLLFLAGVTIFYILQVRKNSVGNDIKVQEEQSSFGIDKFEMRGDEYGADSVVVEN